MVEVALGRQAVLGDLVDVEGKLGTDVLVRALGVVDVGTILDGQRGKLAADSQIDRLRVTYGVSQIVRESADGEGNVVRAFGVAEEGTNEVTGAHVVQQVGEERSAEGIVAEVLDHASAIGVGLRLA